MPIPTRTQSVRHPGPEKKKTKAEGEANARTPAVTKATSHLPLLRSASQSTSRTGGSTTSQSRLTTVTAIPTGHATRPPYSTSQPPLSHRQPSGTQAIPAARRRISPNVPPDITAPAADWTRLHDELLQLSLLDSMSQETARQYQADVDFKLRSRFNGLSEEHGKLTALEKDRKHMRDSLALQAWFEDPAASTLNTGKVQALAGCVQHLTDLTGDDGLLTSVMQHFERWVVHATEIQERRSKSVDTTQEDLLFVEPLGPAWLEQMVHLQERLGNQERVLESLGRSEGSLGAVLENHLALVTSILHQLQICLDIERLLLVREHDWMQDTCAGLLSASSGQIEQTPVRKGSWHTRTAAWGSLA